VGRRALAFGLATVVAALIGVGLAAATAWRESGSLEWPWQAARQPVPPAEPAPAGSSPEVVDPDAELVFVWRAPACLREVVEYRAPPRRVAGAAREELAQLYPEWSVESFSSRRVVLARTYDAMCDELERFRLITLKDGRVAVYYGRRWPLVVLKEVTDLTVDRLRQADLERLEAGIELEGDAAVLEFLEGLTH